MIDVSNHILAKSKIESENIYHRHYEHCQLAGARLCTDAELHGHPTISST